MERFHFRCFTTFTILATLNISNDVPLGDVFQIKITVGFKAISKVKQVMCPYETVQIIKLKIRL